MVTSSSSFVLLSSTTATLMALIASASASASASAADTDTDTNENANDDDNLDELHDRPSFDFVGLLVFVVAVGGLGYAALKLAGRGDMFGESGYLAEQERLAREEAARQAEEEKAKETEYRLN